MRIAIIGYGKMGHEIEKIAIERNHLVSYCIDLQNKHDFSLLNPDNTDVAIEFSNPEAAFNNISHCLDAGIPVVSGTTGWLSQFEEAVKLCNQRKLAFFYASNYSLGVNILFKLNKELSRIMNEFTGYDVDIEEIHHTTKLDAPSGTAITLANGICENYHRKKSWELGTASSPEVIAIKAIRLENIPGVHTVTWDSDIDTLKIHHSAKGRKGLAYGAVLAAEFLKGKQGVFGMNDLLQF
jgi:4-hydroxy-tetrahydrodipicolinate reductase